MLKIWFERVLPDAYAHYLGNEAEPCGFGTQTPNDPLCKLPGADAIVASAPRITYDGALMDKAGPSLKTICRTGIGVDNVKIPEATERSIVVCNAPEAGSISTAEHAFALMLAMTKHLLKNHRILERGEKKDYFNENKAVELPGKTLALVGMGKIGGLMAKMCVAMGMKVKAYFRTVARDPDEAKKRVAALGIDVELCSSIDEVMKDADVVSLHIPLNDQSRNAVGAKQFSLMKKGSYLVNCARGGIVDEAALIEALDSGQLLGAGMDVFAKEPLPADSPLLNRDDVMCTPHVAAATAEGKEKLWSTAMIQALQVCRGERPAYMVNPQVWDKRRK